MRPRHFRRVEKVAHVQSQEGKKWSEGLTGRVRQPERLKSCHSWEARAQSARRGGAPPRGRPRAPPGARPGRGRRGRGGEEGAVWRAGGGRGAGAREGLSTRRFWLKYSKWRTEEQRVKMRVQPRRQQQQVIITAFYIFIFILNPGSAAPPAT